MKSPLRLVCGECLRSAEEAPGGHPGLPGICPLCGGALRVASEPRFSTTIEAREALSLELSPDFSALWESSDTEAPHRLGRYQLRDRLGGGGFGQVYRAFDPRLGREVALKLLTESRPSPRVMERFFREARAAAQLDHPNIVPLHDAGRDEGRCWIAYQFIPGSTLAQVIERGPIEPRRAVGIVRELADAVHHAHIRGVFHRDIKPANVILDPSGRPRLTDFGLARRIDIDPTLTREGTVLGTPAYMSPEQAAGNSHQADARSDVYSLGVVLHELLSGRRPAESSSTWLGSAGSPQALSRSTAPAAFPSGIPKSLIGVCQRTLADAPSGRYPDARRLADELGRWLDRTDRRSGRLRGALVLTPLVLAGLALSNRAAIPRSSPTPLVADRPAVAAVSGPAHPAAVPEKVSGPFVGNKETHVFHRSDCRHLAALRRDHAAVFASQDEAESRGFHACSLGLEPARGR